MANVQVDSGARANSTPTPVVIRSWERPFGTAVLVVALVLGGIAGLKSLIGLFP
jgi:hypothetical protein